MDQTKKPWGAFIKYQELLLIRVKNAKKKKKIDRKMLEKQLVNHRQLGGAESYNGGNGVTLAIVLNLWW